MATKNCFLNIPAFFVAILITCFSRRSYSAVDKNRLYVNMNLVSKTLASDLGAFCLDGSLPAYHLHRGFGPGADNWLLQFEGGGWCNDVKTCLERAKTRRGSTNFMNKWAVFSGILSNDPMLNPDFYNWNRVKIRYCDGGSFAGNSTFGAGNSLLYFRGQKIWEAVLRDLLPKGMQNAKKALLSGCSAGGLAVYLHCDDFSRYLPKTTTVKCLGDAGFFMNLKDISSNYRMRSFYKSLVTLQGIHQNLNPNCMRTLEPELCIFPQYQLKHITTPFFILNSAYDVFQFHHGLAPPSADPSGSWTRCSADPAACTPAQINTIQGMRNEMLAALQVFGTDSKRHGMFINSCFAHCQSESQDTWLANNSPRVNHKTIAGAIGDWYYDRKVAMEIDCPYPCDATCHNLIPAPPGSQIE